jgi:hypothetical protein
MTSSTVASRPARTVNAKRFGGLKVHDKIEVSGLRDWANAERRAQSDSSKRTHAPQQGII